MLLLLLDLSAAFDTVDHDILLKQFAHNFGVKGCVNKWFSSCLENRTMQVFIDGAYSPDFIMQYGLPQGSVHWDLSFTLMLLATSYIIVELNNIFMLMIYKYISSLILAYLVMLHVLCLDYPNV